MTLTEAQFRADLVTTGIAQVGHLYRDSSNPTNWPPAQFDCSVFTHWLNAKHGVNIDEGTYEPNKAWPPPEPRPWHKYPGYTLDQQAAARAHAASIVHFADIKPGDRLYYDKPGQHHVVEYIGNGRVVHAAGTAYGVIISPVVGPGEVGHGGKTLSLCVSATKFARAVGYPFAASPAPKPPAPKPPVGKTVYLSHLLSAIKKDGPAAQGHTTFKSEVLLVENALVKERLLAANLADGSAGTLSFGRASAYSLWQRRLGYTGKDADGIPGIASLTTLGRKYGFRAV